jgi:hypothetical protein
VLHNPLSLLVAVPVGAAGVSLLFMRQTETWTRRNLLLAAGLCIAIALAQGSAAFDPPYHWSVRTKALAVLGLALGVTVLARWVLEYRRSRPRRGGSS